MATILNPRSIARIKKTLSRFYTGQCSVTVKEAVEDPETAKIRPVKRTLYENIPCRLSHDSNATAGAYERNTSPQTIELFLDNIYTDIPAGAQISVTQDGVTNLYGAASEPNVFETHQEIELILWRDWSGTRD